MIGSLAVDIGKRCISALSKYLVYQELQLEKQLRFLKIKYFIKRK